MEQKILIWTCVLIFVSTSIITVLGLIRKVNIERTYLNKLFIALILEIIAIVVWVFSQFFTTQNTPFIRTTFPTSDIVVDSTQENIFIKGVALLNKNQKIKIIAIIETDSAKFELNQTNNRDEYVFELKINNNYEFPAKLKIIGYLEENGKVIKKDEEINIQINK